MTPELLNKRIFTFVIFQVSGVFASTFRSQPRSIHLVVCLAFFPCPAHSAETVFSTTMEIAGLAVSIAGLSSLFNSCLVAIEQVDSYRKFGVESRYITARFDADKILFERWASGVGIVEGKLKEVHHVQLDDVTTAAAVRRILSSIHEIFSLTDSTASKLQFQAINDNLSSITTKHDISKERFMKLNKSQALAPRRGKVQWALGGKAKFITQVETFGVLVDKLRKLIPLGEATTDLDPSLTGQLDEPRNLLEGTVSHSVYMRTL
jgi:hypothetical protein